MDGLEDAGDGGFAPLPDAVDTLVGRPASGKRAERIGGGGHEESKAARRS
jgi:hypothetical protein